MERKAKNFEFGYPHFYKGLCYLVPNEKNDYRKNLRRKKEKLGELLINNLRGYIEQFKVHTSCPSFYPYLQSGERGLDLHLGDGGRWIEVGCESTGFSFVNVHNLDSYVERAVAFNIGSDALEYLDLKILAPRVLLERKNYIIRQNLPRNLQLIPLKSLQGNKETIQGILELVELDTNIKLTLNNKYQEIKTPEGVIEIQKGVCEAKNFENWNIPRASYVTAKLMDLCIHLCERK